MSKSRRDMILAKVSDMAMNFLSYDRQEDEELGLGEIEKAVDAGEITTGEIVGEFIDKLEEYWGET